MSSKFYTRNIAEGKTFLILSIIIATAMRALYFTSHKVEIKINAGGYLWNMIAHWFQSPIVSLLASSLAVIIIASLLAFINTHYAFVRERTTLPSSFALLLLSCHPSFIVMQPELIGAIIFLYIIIVLFGSYHTNQKPIPATNSAFALALGSLFVPYLLLLLPLLWIGLAMMRSFSFGAFFASLFGCVIVYFPAFSYYLFTNDLASFYQPFVDLIASDISYLPLMKFDVIDWIIFGYLAFVLLIAIIDCSVNSYKDKIKIRSFFTLCAVFVVVLSILFLCSYPLFSTSFFLILVLSPLVLSHYFALDEGGSKVFLFYFSFILYLILCSLPFMFFNV